MVMDEYLNNIASEFPEGIITIHGNNRNIHCKVGILYSQNMIQKSFVRQKSKKVSFEGARGFVHYVC